MDLDLSAPDVPDWPMFGWTDDVRGPLAAASAREARCVLATLHTVAGGSPRPPGSQMLIVEDELYGFLSGGCIEGDVVAHGREVLRAGAPQRLVYGDGGPFADIRLVCGGRVEILLERLEPRDDAVRQLLDAFAARRPALWASDGVTRLCWPEGLGAALDASRGMDQAMARLAEAPNAVCVSVGGGRAVAVRYMPVRRLVIVGHDPTALAIAALGVQSGFDTHLVRPKGPTDGPPLSGIAYHRGDVAAVFAAIGLDRWTYVAVATHAVELDEEALVHALPSPAAYVGVLGARRRLSERLARLRARGLAPADLSRLHAPIGLDIGGKAPFEIAFAVLGEVVAQSVQTRPKEFVCDVRSASDAAA